MKNMAGKAIRTAFFGLSLLLTVGVFGQSKDQKLIADAQAAKAEFIRTDNGMASRFANAYGYVIFPNVGKGGIGIGGAAGNGIVWEKGRMVGHAKMTQVSIGFQWGGQAYREVIFFENKATLDQFKGSKYEFSAQASAVAATAGASANANFKNGVMIFTQQKGGLMYEASVGGQKFKYTGY
jgi:lipid-binding SYLF domain-containing protein